jgi:hypothetical protein
MSAHLMIKRPNSDQLRILVGEGQGTILAFVLFVTGLACVLYLLMPAARATPAWLIGVVALSLGWGVVAWTATEEYLVDQSAKHVVMLYTRQ